MRLTSTLTPLTVILASGALTSSAIARPLPGDTAAADGAARHAHVRPAHRIGDQSAVAYISEHALRSYTFQPSGPPPPDPGPCPLTGRHRRALIVGVFAHEHPVTCTISPATQVIINDAWTGCSSVEDPPFYGADAAAQRACVIQNAATFITTYTVSVDGAPPVNIIPPCYVIITPQLSFHLPPDNVFGKPEQDGTLVEHTWMAEVHGLRPGRHTLTMHAIGADFDATGSVVVVVAPGGHGR
jgi:hypothetical protein